MRVPDVRRRVAGRLPAGRSSRRSSPVVGAIVVAFGAAASGLAVLRRRKTTPTWFTAPLGLMSYAGAAAAVAAKLALLRGDRVAGAVAGTSAGLVAASIAPRLIRGAQPAAQGPQLTVMSANVLKGRADPVALVDFVRAHAPDALMLQEQHPRFLAALDRAGIRDLLPHRIAGSGGRADDSALLSRWPLLPLSVRLPGSALGAVAVLGDGSRLPLIAAHPMAPAGRRNERRWRKTLEGLPQPRGTMARGIIAGDLNATLDHPELRSLLACGWRDAGAEAGRGLTPTWGGFVLARMTLDHVLLPPGAALLDYRVDDIAGSDHRAVTVRLRLPCEARTPV